MTGAALQCRTQSSLPLLIVTEGVHDVEFLKRISGLLQAADPQLPDLAVGEQAGELVFLPIGGGEIAAWDERLRRLANPRFQLHDRETGPEAWRRLTAAAAIDGPQCVARLTSKRALENYLHPRAIQAAGGPPVDVTDQNDVPAAVAAANLRSSRPELPWEVLGSKARRRFANRAKRWLNGPAVDAMTPDLLDERDPAGDVRSWFASMAALLAG